VTTLSVLIGTANAFLMERFSFPGKGALSVVMLAPLVIPGVILGISILAFASRIADLCSDLFGWELDFLRPGLPLVVLGQFSYIAAIATLTIGVIHLIRASPLRDILCRFSRAGYIMPWTMHEIGTMPRLKSAYLSCRAQSIASVSRYRITPGGASTEWRIRSTSTSACPPDCHNVANATMEPRTRTSALQPRCRVFSRSSGKACSNPVRSR